MNFKSKSNQKVFEGKVYREINKRLKQKKRYYKDLDINKIIISDLYPNFISRSTFSNLQILNTIKETFLAVIWLFLFKFAIIIKQNSKSNIWMLLSPSHRQSHFSELNVSNLSEKASLVTWKTTPIHFAIFERFLRILKFIYYLYFSELNFIALNVRVKICVNILKAIDLYDDFINQVQPKAVFSAKDFQRFENAIIQAANINKIPTFTSPHSVHHFFTGKNERNGNIIFTNSTAKNILCWGKFNDFLFKKYNPTANIYNSKAIFRPSIDKKLYNKKKKEELVVVLGGIRHLSESENLLTLLKEVENLFYDKLIHFRPHPSSDKKEVLNLIIKFKFKFHFVIDETKKSHKYIYSKSTIFITGLSGTYYDALYLGYKVIFFDFNYSVKKKLPRVMTGFKNSTGLINQIKKCKKINRSIWKKKANVILLNTLGLKMLEKRKKSIHTEIIDIIS